MTNVDYDAGADAERLVNQVLRRDGWYTSPAHGLEPSENKAPLFIADSEKLIMPDIFAMCEGSAFWVEVKQFEQPVRTRKRNQLEHGVRSRKFEAYQRTRQASGLAVWLVVFEEESGELIAAEIDELSELPPVSREHCMREYGELVSYFARDDFSVISVSEDDVPAEFPHSVKLETGVSVQHLIQTQEIDMQDRDSITAYTDGGTDKKR